jgi:arylsulfatase A-like enzyme
LSSDRILTELTRVERPDSLTQEEYAQAAGFQEQIYAAYTQAAASAGARVKALLSSLESHRGDRPLVVYVTSAGGLSLGETSGTPSLPRHPVFQEILLERTTHVPLLIFEMDSTATEGQERTHPVELLDITPTVLARAGAIPLVDAAGDDLVAEALSPPADSSAYSEFGDMLSVRVGSHFLMARMWMHGGTSLNPEITDRLREGHLPQASFTLHDVLLDPLQAQDLLETDPDSAERLKAVLLKIREGAGAVNLGDFSEDEVDLLIRQRTDGYW